METTIGINQRIPIGIIELAIKAVLDDRYDDEYAAELARMEFSGENRIKKTVKVINRIVKTNVLMPYLVENTGKVRQALKNPDDRGMICISLVNAAYPFCYDVTAVLGRYFHAQKEIGTPLITSKLSAKYGTNRSLPNGLYCILPMLIEAGFITRPRPGFYQMSHLAPQTDIAKVIYQKSFLANNPTLNEDYNFSNHFYFEFVG
ncbi:MAG: hypothetical protein IKQ59_00465 [Prevotella sp.]|nr:hypothetical protein [Prevotella sp.]